MELREHSYANPVYNSWKDMRKRCCNPLDKSYKYYGGKGVKVCPEWLASFQKFCDDMLPSYFPGGTIDRIDNSLGYNKDNCKWSTKTEQQQNRSNVFGYKDRTLEVKQLRSQGLTQTKIGKILGMSQSTVRRILAND